MRESQPEARRSSVAKPTIIRILLSFSLTAVAAAPIVWGVGLVAAKNGAARAEPLTKPAFEEPAHLPPFAPSTRGEGVMRLAQLHTDIPDRGRLEVLQYTVQAGDTPWSIAEKFDLEPESILWANDGLSAEAGNLAVGVTLNIPPVDGVVHVVREGDTFGRLELLHGTPVETILDFLGNGFDLSEPRMEPGMKVIVPGGRSQVLWQEPGPRVVAGLGRRSPGLYSGPLVYIGTGVFTWPVSPVRITQSYWSGHPAIDIDTYNRQPVFAADSGTAIFSGWDATGYGNLLIVDHGNGYWTYYAHNEANLVGVGEGVLQGQQIAESGSTGNSTGDHLDFRIRLQDAGFLNPLDFLP